jgi:hypothetical protein
MAQHRIRNKVSLCADCGQATTGLLCGDCQHKHSGIQTSVETNFSFNVRITEREVANGFVIRENKGS